MVFAFKEEIQNWLDRHATEWVASSSGGTPELYCTDEKNGLHLQMTRSLDGPGLRLLSIYLSDQGRGQGTELCFFLKMKAQEMGFSHFEVCAPNAIMRYICCIKLDMEYDEASDYARMILSSNVDGWSQEIEE